MYLGRVGAATPSPDWLETVQIHRATLKMNALSDTQSQMLAPPWSTQRKAIFTHHGLLAMTLVAQVDNISRIGST